MDPRRSGKIENIFHKALEAEEGLLLRTRGLTNPQNVFAVEKFRWLVTFRASHDVQGRRFRRAHQ
jgi:hypothetical protein